MVSTRLTQCQISVTIFESLETMTQLKFIVIQIATPTYNRMNSNLLKKLLQKNKEDQITTQSLVIKPIWEQGMKSAAEIWSKSILKLVSAIFHQCFIFNQMAALQKL